MGRIFRTSVSAYIRNFLYLGCLLFLGMIVVCLVGLKGENKLIGIGFLPFFALGAMSILGFRDVYIDNERLVSKSFLGSYCIRWDEIEHVWFDGSKLNFLVEGHGKRISIPGPVIWAGPDKDEMVVIMRKKFDEISVEPKLNSIRTLLFSNKSAKILN